MYTPRLPPCNREEFFNKVVSILEENREAKPLCYGYSTGHNFLNQREILLLKVEYDSVLTFLRAYKDRGDSMNKAPWPVLFETEEYIVIELVDSYPEAYARSAASSRT